MPCLEWTSDAGDVRRLYADVWKQEELTLAATVTQHSVESGSKPTDHYRKEPESLRVELFFSNSPLRGDLDEDFPGEVRNLNLTYKPYPTGGLIGPAALTALANSLLGTGGKYVPPSAVQVLRFEHPVDRWRKAIDLIREWQTKGTLITVISTMGRFESMAIPEGRPMRAVETGDGCSIPLEFQQISFVSSDVAVAVPLVLEPRAQSKKSAASATPSTSAPEQESALHKALNWWRE
jgi:hypothetical protein